MTARLQQRGNKSSTGNGKYLSAYLLMERARQDLSKKLLLHKTNLWLIGGLLPTQTPYPKIRSVRHSPGCKIRAKSAPSMSKLICKVTSLLGRGNLYGFRNWVEYAFKQGKNELGWADFRLTNYQQIEKWWRVPIWWWAYRHKQELTLAVTISHHHCRG